MLVRDLLPDLGRDWLGSAFRKASAAPRLSGFPGAFRIGDDGPFPMPPPTSAAASKARVTLSSTLRRTMLVRDLLATSAPPEAAPAPPRVGPPPSRRASLCTAGLTCCISCISSGVSPDGVSPGGVSPDRGRHASARPLEAEPPRRRLSAPSSCGAKGGTSTCTTIGPSASGGMHRVAARWPGLRGRMSPTPTASDAECLSGFTTSDAGAAMSKVDLLRGMPGDPLRPPRRWLGEPLREFGDPPRPKTSSRTRSSKSSPSALSKGVCARDGSALVSERRLVSDCDRDCDARDCARDCTRDGSADSPFLGRRGRSAVGKLADQLRGRSLGGSGRRFVSVRRRSIWTAGAELLDGTLDTSEAGAFERCRRSKSVRPWTRGGVVKNGEHKDKERNSPPFFTTLPTNLQFLSHSSAFNTNHHVPDHAHGPPTSLQVKTQKPNRYD